MSLGAKRDRERPGRRRIVLDEQNPFLRRGRLFPNAGPRGCRLELGWPRRDGLVGEIHHESRTVARAATGRREGAAVQLDDGARARESETQASSRALLGLLERAEQAFDDGRRSDRPRRPATSGTPIQSKPSPLRRPSRSNERSGPPLGRWSRQPPWPGGWRSPERPRCVSASGRRKRATATKPS